MTTFTDFSGRNAGPVTQFVFPNSLATLVQAVNQAEAAGLSVHACGSKWAFSAPAYCEGVVIETSQMDDFPAWLQRHILDPEPAALNRDGTRSVLVAVEAGIQLRQLYLSLEGSGAARHSIAGLLNGRQLALPTMGGAGGQLLGGLTQTGTHGGDVARPRSATSSTR